MFQVVGVLVSILLLGYGAYTFLRALRGNYQDPDVRPAPDNHEFHCDECRDAFSPKPDAQRESTDA